MGGMETNSRPLALKDGAVLVATIVDDEGREVQFNVILLDYGITLVPLGGGGISHLTWPQAYAAGLKEPK